MENAQWLLSLKRIRHNALPWHIKLATQGCIVCMQLLVKSSNDLVAYAKASEQLKIVHLRREQLYLEYEKLASELDN